MGLLVYNDKTIKRISIPIAVKKAVTLRYFLGSTILGLSSLVISVIFYGLSSLFFTYSTLGSILGYFMQAAFGFIFGVINFTILSQIYTTLPNKK